MNLSLPDETQKPSGEQTRRSSHCSTLLEWAGTLPTGADEYTLDDIMKADAIVDAWCGEHAGDDYEPIDSAWLGKLGGEEDQWKNYVFRPILFSCEGGKWIVYSNGSSHWHKLGEVDCRRDVRLWLRAIKRGA